MRNFVTRLTVLAAMALVIGAAGYQFSQTTTASAAAQLCSNSCYVSCRNASTFCRNNPNGYWNNGYAGGECSEFVSTDFCCKWECPNTTPKFSRCVENPTLPSCQPGTDPVQQYCSDTYQYSCSTQCANAVANCPSGRGRCASAVVSSPVGSQCACTYTVECFP